MAGDTTIEIGGTDGKAETTLSDDRKTLHLAGWGDGSRASAVDLGITFAHEAFRDGIVGTADEQDLETTEAVVGHTQVALMVEQRYGREMLSDGVAEETEMFREAQRTGDWSGFGAHVAGSYDSSADYWKLMSDGTLVYDGQGWLVDEEGNYVRNADGERIGADGVETGLLNILNGGTSGAGYDTFTEEQKRSAQALMTDAGIRSGYGDLERRMWSSIEIGPTPWGAGPVDLAAVNMGKALNMDSVMRQYGERVATEVFANRYWDKATKAFQISGGNASSPSIAASVSELSEAGFARFQAFSTAISEFYGDGLAAAAGFTEAHGISSRLTFSGAGQMRRAPELNFYLDGMHKGVDFPMLGGTSIPAFFSGQISNVDALDDSNAGRSVSTMLGFNFEGTFLSTGVESESFHLESISEGMTEGLYVSSGTTIGLSGNTDGTEAGGTYHLHQQFVLPGGYDANYGNVANPYANRMNGFLETIGAQQLGAGSASILFGSEGLLQADFLSTPGLNWNTFQDFASVGSYQRQLYVNINPLFEVQEWIYSTNPWQRQLPR